MLLKPRLLKALALTVTFCLISEICFPAMAFALTGGPSQPEVQSFTPAGVSEMVDPFSGDFTYNIPLLDIDGYPINISYQSGVTMDQEASWVGLGWNLNPGVVNRAVRGLPDDFSGEIIEKQYNLRPNTTVGVNGGFGAELFGYEGANLNASIGINYNNYTGIGFEQSVSISFDAGSKGYGPNTSSLSLGLTSSSNGLTISPSYSLGDNESKHQYFSASASYNSRTGLQSLTIKNYTPKALNGATIPGRSISFAAETFTPNIGMSMNTTSISASFKAGLTLFGLEGTGNLSGYLTTQRLLKKDERIPSFGYMYSQNAMQNPKILHDFNREKDQSFNENTPALPVTNYTYDIFTVTGQGVGGTFRPFRGDIGYVYDNEAINKSNSYSIGGEVSGAGLVKIGADVGVNLVRGKSGAWTTNNNAASKLKFQKGADGSLFEPFYFKKVGELSAESEPGRFNDLGASKPVGVELLPGGGMDVMATSNFQDNNGNVLPIQSTVRSKRERRNEVISYLTKAQADKFGLEYIAPRPYAQPHHIAAVTALQPDGSRYVYGVAAYNLRKEETTFNVGMAPGGTPPVPICNKGLILYTDKQDSKDNENGIDHYYNKVITPPYVHSYLLTAVLSADYADVDAVRGPSDGDLGSYTKFNYRKQSGNYKWRVPVEEDMANYNQGLKSDETDDKADYVYGEKELWYLESIVTKNHIAIFHTSARKDAHAVKDNRGGKGDESMQQLDRITLYSKRDYDANPGAAVPIKEVHFVYSNQLCPNLPNSSGTGIETGKLTLEKLYFTYGNSYKGKHSPYTFYYREDNSLYNPEYNLKGYDRWGNYKPNAETSCEYNSATTLTSEDPYVIQEKAKADEYSTVWHLTEVGLPSGGKVKVTYESDDYAYVQDKRAMQMFNVVSVSNSTALSPAGTTLMDGNNYNLYLHFKLSEELPNTSASVTKFYNDYIDDISEIYFRFLVDMTQSGDYEFVNGYAELDKAIFGLNTGGSANYTHGYIKLKSVGIGDRKNGGTQVHPISKAAWQFGRMSLPQKVWDGVDRTESAEEQIIRALASSSFAKNIVETFKGPNRTIRDKGYGKNVQLNKSWVRLYNPTRVKFGGGSRVKKIEMIDGWSAMAPGQSDFQYGQLYEYTTYDTKAGKNISSGVAANEPMIGGEENPLRRPVWFGDKQQKLLAPDDKFYMEEPFGESFYPSASVGYAEVKVTSLKYANVNKHATGRTIHKFYTAKDFPTISNRTPLNKIPMETSPILKIFSITYKNYMTASQGFVVELNDMHGKKKALEVYGEGQSTPISKKEYKYKSEPYINGASKLVNSCLVMNSDGSTSNTDIGIEYDVVADMRQQESSTHSTHVGGNLNTIFAFIPIPVPTIFPMYNKEKVRFRSAGVTKVIHRYGILEEVTAYDLGSKITTKNLAYDSETGELLLTQVNNNFNDPIYMFKYPAHWYYEGMGGAYKNIGYTKSITVNSGSASVVNARKFFTPGDELVLISGASRTLAWVTSVDPSAISLINEAGNSVGSGSYTATVIRSGRRNLQTNMMGSLTTTINPVNLIKNGNLSQILEAEAIEYTDEATKAPCECFESTAGYFSTLNPYLTGLKGTWKVKKNYKYLTGRELAIKNQNTNARTDGKFTSFSPFWRNDGSKWVKDDTRWTWPAEATLFSPFNVELESKDALNRYSAAIYGYNFSLPIAIGKNSEYSDIAFDNFEDYDFTTCTIDHFSYKNYPGNITEDAAHSGRRSIRVDASSPLDVLKYLENCP